jgi:hypothetical protein
MSETSSPQAGHPGAVRRERDERIDALVVRVRTQAGSAQADSLERCVRELLRQHDDDDIAAASPDDLLGAVLSLWQHGTRRTPDAPKVRVLNPSVSDSGWASRHTVIEIVNDDMPFLVDSTAMAINSQGLTLHLIAHPVFAVERQADGALLALRMPQEAPSAARESWMHIEVDRIVDPQRRAALVAALEHTLAEVRAAVTDWPAMRARLEQAAGELQAAQAALPAGATDESVAFLSWLADDHFTLLGYRCHDLIAGADGADGLRLVGGSGLGVLRETEADQLSASFAVLPPKAREMARAPLPLLLVTKANTRSTVHRPGYTDYIGVKRYDAAGRGDRRAPLHRPVHVHRLQHAGGRDPAAARQGAQPGRARRLRLGRPPGKALQHPGDLPARRAVPADRRRAATTTRWASWRWANASACACSTWARPLRPLRLVPGLRAARAYSTDLRMKLQAILINAFNGTRAEFDVQLGDATLARIHFTVRTVPGQVPPFDRKRHRARLAAAARRWDDELSDALVEARARRAAWSCSNVLAARSRWPTANAWPRAPRCPTCASSPRSRPRSRWRLALVPAAGCAARHAGLSSIYRLGGAGGAVGQPADARAHGRCACSASTTTGSRRRGHPRGAARLRLQAQLPARLEADDAGACSRTPSCACCAARSRTTTSTAWCCAPACRRARWWCCAPTPSTSSRSALRCRRPPSKPRSRRTPPSRACWSSCSSCASTRPSTTTRPPRRRPAVSNGHSRRWRTCPRTACCASCRRSSSARCAPTSGAPAAGIRARPARCARSCRSSSTRRRCRDCPRRGPCRDLRLLAALRGHPPARRQGGARRAALVRPPRGLPHRGARRW